MRAAKEKRRPPFTTFATRLTLMVRSSYCWSAIDSELQSGLAGRVGYSRHAAVILETAPVEHHLADTGGARPLGDQASNRRGPRDVGGVAGVAERLFHCGGGGERPAGA